METVANWPWLSSGLIVETTEHLHIYVTMQFL